MAQAAPTKVQPELKDVHEQSQLSSYLSGVWARRQYVWYQAASDLRGRQINTALGNLWHLLNPLLTVGTFYLVFGLVLGTDRGVDNFLLFLTVGIFFFQFI